MTKLDPKLLFATALRDSIHNLDLSVLANQKIFSNYIRSFICLHEDIRFEAYDDKIPIPKNEGGGSGRAVSRILADGDKVIGKVTIGVGFNMDAGDDKKGGRADWDKAFKNNDADNKDKVDFDEAYDGKLQLTQEQVDQLLDHSIKIRVAELEQIYKESWSKLRANERITIISAYFNCPGLVLTETDFYKKITKYAKNSDEKDLLAAVTEIKEKSNSKKSKGIQNRRDCEAAMLDSTKAPFYSKPDSKLIQNKLIKIIAGETIVPIDIDRYSSKKTNSEYFIWRTMLDDKVRPEHLKNEGKVFLKKDYNDEKELKKLYPNCRCIAAEVTENLYIVPNLNIQKPARQKPGYKVKKFDANFIDRFIRFGGGKSILW